MESIEFIEGGRIPREEWEMEVKGEEWTDPADGRKECFFRNLDGVVREERKGGVWNIWEAVMVVVGVFAVIRTFNN